MVICTYLYIVTYMHNPYIIVTVSYECVLYAICFKKVQSIAFFIKHTHTTRWQTEELFHHFTC